jgi:hypothetical protein
MKAGSVALALGAASGEERMAEGPRDSLVDVKFLDEVPPDKERWEQAIRAAYGSGFGKARLRKSAQGWEVTVAHIHEPSAATASETMPAPRDARALVVSALRKAGLPVTD